MNLKKLLGGKTEIITAAERRQLEDMDKTCLELETARKQVEQWPGNPAEREAKIRQLAGEYATNPNPEKFQKIQEAGALPPSGDIKNFVLGALDEERKKRMLPSHAIVRAVFARAEKEATEERSRLVAKEKTEAEDVGVPYVAGPRVRKLEEQIFAFRGEIAVRLPGETDEPFQEPAHWRQRLAEFI